MILTIAGILVWPLPAPPNVGTSGDFLIYNVTVVDVADGTLREGQSVVIRAGRIVSVTPAKPAMAAPMIASITLIDATGKYLIPGLWDMHTHSNKFSSQYQHPLLLANGVTGVRDLWGCMSEPDSFFACISDRSSWNAALGTGAASPRYIRQSSFQINGGNEVPAHYPDFFKVKTPEAVSSLVDYYADAGADFLKVYSELSPATYRSLANAASDRGLSLEGHRPMRVSLLDVIEVGQRSVEHPRLFLFECFAGAEEFRALADPLTAYNSALRRRVVDEHDDERCKTLMSSMSRSDTWWTPTLGVLRMNAFATDLAYRADARLKYVPYLFKKFMWEQDIKRTASLAIDESGRNVYMAMYQLALRNVGQAHAAGVRILTGTDTFDSYIFPGFSLHDELADLVLAGLSPADALRSATLNAAIFSGVESEFGSIEVGKFADMILLNADPLIDIHNSKSIDGLFFSGRFFDRPSLDNLLQFAQRRANSIHNNLHIFWAAIRSPLVRVQFAD